MDRVSVATHDVHAELMDAVLDYGIAKAQAAAARDVEELRSRTYAAQDVFVRVTALAAQLRHLADEANHVEGRDPEVP